MGVRGIVKISWNFPEKLLAMQNALLYNIQAMNLTGGPLAGRIGSRYERCEGKEELQWQMY